MNEDRTILSAAKYRPMTLVSGNIRCMRIFVGFPLGRASNENIKPYADICCGFSGRERQTVGLSTTAFLAIYVLRQMTLKVYMYNVIEIFIGHVYRTVSWLKVSIRLQLVYIHCV